VVSPRRSPIRVSRALAARADVRLGHAVRVPLIGMLERDGWARFCRARRRLVAAWSPDDFRCVWHGAAVGSTGGSAVPEWASAVEATVHGRESGRTPGLGDGHLLDVRLLPQMVRQVLDDPLELFLVGLLHLLPDLLTLLAALAVLREGVIAVEPLRDD
jgi:hypothetical protein